MKRLELDTNLLISVNDEQQIKVFNQDKNHLVVYLPNWELVSYSGFRKHLSLTKINRLLNHVNLLLTIYINNRKVITLGNKQALGLANVKLVYLYVKNLLTGK